MIEMLTLLSESSPKIDNMARYVTSQLCISCGGKSKKKKLACSRCGGSGRMLETGNQKSSRSARDDSRVTAADVAVLCAGLPRHKWWAALVYVNNDESAALKLQEHLFKKVIWIAAKSWKMKEDDDDVIAQILSGLAIAAVYELSIYPERAKPVQLYTTVGVSKNEWHNKWKARHQVNISRLLQWRDDVEQHMVKNYFQGVAQISG